jgi:hypothetical protein
MPIINNVTRLLERRKITNRAHELLVEKLEAREAGLGLNVDRETPPQGNGALLRRSIKPFWRGESHQMCARFVSWF